MEAALSQSPQGATRLEQADQRITEALAESLRKQAAKRGEVEPGEESNAKRAKVGAGEKEVSRELPNPEIPGGIPTHQEETMETPEGNEVEMASVEVSEEEPEVNETEEYQESDYSTKTSMFGMMKKPKVAFIV